MTLTQILVFTAACLLAGWLVRGRAATWLLLGGSVLAIYWMQPATPIRNLDFWFPTASILITVLVWAVTQPAQDASTGAKNLRAAVVIAALVLAVGLTRYLEPLCCLTATPPPAFTPILLSLVIGGAVAAVPGRMAGNHRCLATAAILATIALFLFLKSEALARLASGWLRALSDQDTSLASGLDLRWLGFSYLAFRLLHALRDFQLGRLPAYSLGEFVTYAIFFPAYTAGPIDRSQHFTAELRQASDVSADPAAQAGSRRMVPGLERILLGVFKKFVLADTLALAALSPQNALQAQAGLWMWVLLYAYALRIYFDFSGYTDVALGLARLVGIRLPENFDRPYLATNLTAFWNRWHITLAQWFRAYFFNPATRWLRLNAEALPPWTMILLVQLATMALIGLWHGITWNFVLWGAWHGAGLFVHNRWSDWRRSHPAPTAAPSNQRLLAFASWLATFHYVVLGWVWFALPDVSTSLLVFQKLAGLPGKLP